MVQIPPIIISEIHNLAALGQTQMRILLADHYADASQTIKAMLLDQPGFEVVGEAEDEQSLRASANENHPDLVLINCEFPSASIADLINALHSLIPKPMVIVMSNKPDQNRKLLQAGADALVTKENKPDWLIQSLHLYATSYQRQEAYRNSSATGSLP
jgi:two-component system, NarL family, nitrate/nitrite response regulator NarL